MDVEWAMPGLWDCRWTGGGGPGVMDVHRDAIAVQFVDDAGVAEVRAVFLEPENGRWNAEMPFVLRSNVEA